MKELKLTETVDEVLLLLQIGTHSKLFKVDDYADEIRNPKPNEHTVFKAKQIDFATRLNTLTAKKSALPLGTQALAIQIYSML